MIDIHYLYHYFITHFYPEDFVPVVFVLAVFCLIEWIAGRASGLRGSRVHTALKLAFAAYLLLVFQLTVSLRSLWHAYRTTGLVYQGKVMKIPFQEIRDYLRYGSYSQIMANLVGNVVGFIPMGLLPPLLWRWSRKPVFILCWIFVPTCTVEVLQRFTPRVSSIDDVILNATGAAIGYLIFALLQRFGVGEHTLMKS